MLKYPDDSAGSIMTTEFIDLKENMTIAVEPMLTSGTRKIYLLDDDWTIITRDNKPSAHFEHTIIVTRDGYEILTGDDNYEYRRTN